MAGQRILLVDAGLAGIAGDMMLGALVDLGGDPRILTGLARTVTDVYGRGVKVSVRNVRMGEMRARRVGVAVQAGPAEEKAGVIRDRFSEILERTSAGREVARIALRSLEVLTEAEAEVHGVGKGDIDFDELSSPDTAVDIIGTALLLQDLGLLKDTTFMATPIAAGGGTTPYSHGLLSNPGPAVSEILKEQKLITRGGPLNTELTTPTGACLLAGLDAAGVPFYPQMVIERIGYGAGRRNLREIPNILKLIDGRAPPESYRDSVVILETNLDDVSGEIVGYVVDRLYEAGARDVALIPTFGKKNRPGQIIRVIADSEKEETLADLIMRETGTLGVRVLHTIRHVARRSVQVEKVKVSGAEAKVRFKVASDSSGEILRVKPEFEDVAELAKRLGRPVREVLDSCEAEALRLKERLLRPT